MGSNRTSSGAAAATGTCDSCATKSCLVATERSLLLCENGVTYFREGEVFHRLDQPLPLRNLAQNLKHETHKFLQLIVNDACEISPEVTTRIVDLDDPASRIVAATVLINDFVDMLAGVNDFRPPQGAFATRESVSLREMTNRAIKAQSLVKNKRRCKALKFAASFDPDSITVVNGARAIEHIISIIIDNVYKYSVDGTIVDISCELDERDLGVFSVSNICYSLINLEKVFDKGYQANTGSDGFGYGLHWAKLLITYMNEQTMSLIEIDAQSSPAQDGLFMTTFRLSGLPCG